MIPRTVFVLVFWADYFMKRGSHFRTRNLGQMDLVTLEPNSPENLFTEELTQVDEAQARINTLGTL